MVKAGSNSDFNLHCLLSDKDKPYRGHGSGCRLRRLRTTFVNTPRTKVLHLGEKTEGQKSFLIQQKWLNQ